jgi:hypothetical protein
VTCTGDSDPGWSRRRTSANETRSPPTVQGAEGGTGPRGRRSGTVELRE